MQTVVVATIHPWNIRRFREWKPPRGFRKVLVTRKADLRREKLDKLTPRYIFFPHWSWIIPKDVYEAFECVVFHMTDLPFGRGGSPLQNLIVRGIYNTKLSALRVAEGLDTGDIYLKRPFSIKEGSAEEIYERVSNMVFSLMTDIARKNPKPERQRGKPVVFARRTPGMSRIPAGLSGRQLYDFIRMLDAPGYPVAFTGDGGVRVEFRNAELKQGRVRADILVGSENAT